MSLDTISKSSISSQVSLLAPVIYDADFVRKRYPQRTPDELASQLWSELEWERRAGVPRHEYYCNDIQAPYAYGSGDHKRTYLPMPWHPVIDMFRADLEGMLDTRFETCFLNGYADQRDHLGWHADDSPEMDPARPIAIVTLGVEREIWFCPIGDRTGVEKLKLGNGSLCLMQAGMQQTHLHRIPKAGFVCGKRISLTFRGYRK